MASATRAAARTTGRPRGQKQRATTPEDEPSGLHSSRVTASRRVKQSSSQKQHATTPEDVPRYISKTRICSFYLSNCCTRGSSCTFAHGKHELKARPDFTRTQLCPRGASCGEARCTFAHDASELRILAPDDVAILAKSQATTGGRPPKAAQQPPPRAEPPRALQSKDSEPRAREQSNRNERATDDLFLPMKVVTAELLSFQSTWEESTCDGSQSSRSDESVPYRVQIPTLAWSL